MTEQFMENISNEEHERLLLLCGHGIGPSLSPAAQAVLDAFLAEWPDEALKQDRRCLSAALRAVADQVVPETKGPRSQLEYELGDWDARDDMRNTILAIAADQEQLDD